MLRFRIIFCFALFLFSNQLFAQKIKVIDRFSKNENTPVQYVNYEILVENTFFLIAFFYTSG